MVEGYILPRLGTRRVPHRSLAAHQRGRDRPGRTRQARWDVVGLLVRREPPVSRRGARPGRSMVVGHAGGAGRCVTCPRRSVGFGRRRWAMPSARAIRSNHGSQASRNFLSYPHRLVCPTFSLLTNRLSTDVAAADYVDKCRLDGDRRHVKARSPEYGWERCGSVTRWKGSAGKAPAFPAGRSRTALSPRTRIRSGAWSAPPLFVSCVLNGCVGARPGLSCKDRSHGT